MSIFGDLCSLLDGCASNIHSSPGLTRANLVRPGMPLKSARQTLMRIVVQRELFRIGLSHMVWSLSTERKLNL